MENELNFYFPTSSPLLTLVDLNNCQKYKAEMGLNLIENQINYLLVNPIYTYFTIEVKFF